MTLARRLLAALLLCFAAAPADAALIITVGNVDLTPGNPTGQLAVYARTDVGTVDLASFSLGLQITPNNPSSPGQVAFVDPPSDAQYGNPAYVFYLNGLFTPSMLAVPPTAYPNDTLYAGDFYVGALPYPMIGTTPVLLLQTDVTMLTGSPPTGGETFTISVLNDGTTQFLDGNFVDIPYSSVPGIVTTPEPATVAVFGVVALAGLALRRRSGAAVAA